MAGEKILIVEDEAVTSMHIKDVLQKLGYTVSAVVASGEEAVRKAEELRPDLVLMDIVLKEDAMDGIEAARQIRENMEIPVVYLTAHGDEHTLQRAKITEPFGYILKPFNERELKVAIDIGLYKYVIESKIRRLERWLSTTLKSIGDAVIAADKDNNITFMNITAERLTGWKQEEAIGKRITEILNIKDEEVEYLEKHLAEGVIRDGMVINLLDNRILIAKDGREIHIGDSIAPLIEENGVIPGIVLVFRDISRSMKTEIELRESEERFRSTFEQAAVGIAHVGLDGRWLRVNRKLCDIVGYSHDELIEKTFQIITYPEDLAEDLEYVRQLLAGKINTYTMEKRYYRKDGSIIWINLTVSLVRKPSGEPAYFISVIEDITDQKKLREQLFQAQKMEAVGQLAGGISHDFNNILTAIISYGYMLKNKLHEDATLESYADSILALSDRAAILSHNLLTFSRKQVMNAKPVCLNETIRDIEKILLRVIGEDVELRDEIPDARIIIKADNNQIEQALMNLATNARDAMPRGGRLTLRVSLSEIDEGFISRYGYGKAGKYALVSVSDTGVGMDEKTKEKIFEPFFTTKEAGKGTGLGLAMVYGIIKQHEGFINVLSEPGKGTTFMIYLPLLIEEAEETIQASAKPKGGNETVLIAEDDSAVRDVTKIVLEEYGYKVIEARDGEEALHKFKMYRDKIDIVILDTIMPKLSGGQVFEEIRKIKPGLKGFYISGYSAEIISGKGIIEKGAEVIRKPVSPSDLLIKIREALDSKG